MQYHRNLPHLMPAGETLFITFRLAGSLPQVALERLREEKALAERQLRSEAATAAERQEAMRILQKRHFGKYDQLLDHSSRGPTWLKRAAIAGIIKEALHYRDGREYELLAYCIMPNHVHMLVTLPEQLDAPFFRVLQSLKRFTAIAANRLLGQTGQPFWQDESYDHLVRDGQELNRIISYILENPVKAGLCTTWSDCPFSWVKDG